MSLLNPDCDGAYCYRTPEKEVRILPVGGDSNVILCRSCFEHEMRWRSERNKELGKNEQFEIRRWETLEIYPKP